MKIRLGPPLCPCHVAEPAPLHCSPCWHPPTSTFLVTNTDLDHLQPPNAANDSVSILCMFPHRTMLASFWHTDPRLELPSHMEANTVESTWKSLLSPDRYTGGPGPHWWSDLLICSRSFGSCNSISCGAAGETSQAECQHVDAMNPTKATDTKSSSLPTSHKPCLVSLVTHRCWK